jgi:hypothetical protein
MDDEQNVITQKEPPDPWRDDILDRQGFADFLTRVLTEQARVLSERQQRGLTVAVDAEWGAGKTFFIERWAETLRRQGHPVVMFDAWKHDLGEAPVVVLMAAIDEALREWLRRAPIEQEIKQKASELGRKGIRQLRRAVLPTTGVILSGLLKKATGIAWKDLKDATALSDEEDDTADATDAATGASDSDDQTSIDAGLDRIFEQALGEQTQRIEAIERFRSDMGRVIDLIHREAAAKMPVFVFVDELDRCRPSYAISLLEEIKHIFGMPQVCFVVSTNLAQLSHSVRAVYGEGFDAEHYLKRFFDQTHTIPPPDSRLHIKVLLTEHPVLSERKHAHGLPTIRGTMPTVADAIALLFDACRLDLRSQKQVFLIAETAVSAIPRESNVNTMWLFFLAVLAHKNQHGYAELIRKRPDLVGFQTLAASVLYEDKKIIYWDSRLSGKQEASISFVLWRYFEWSSMDADDIYNRASEASSYPDTNIRSIQQELPSSWSTNAPPIPTLRHYIDYVRYAGYARHLVDHAPSND